ncbi:MAG: hypothetical protein P1U67_03995 [Alcanivoracaceae bacterium]|nr:hypothetical protein [Alcanivoracaceae bacterium]
MSNKKPSLKLGFFVLAVLDFGWVRNGELKQLLKAVIKFGLNGV